MSTFLYNICAVDRISSSLFNEYRHLSHDNRALVARAAAATARLRRRRAQADRAPVTPLQKQKRRRNHGFQSLQKLLHRRLEMASHQEIRRRSSAADRAPVAPFVTSTASASASASATTSTLDSSQDEADRTAMPPPSPPAPADASPTRHSRTTSPASRNAHRLSLTLPISCPTSDPSRPTPTYSASQSSVPPTPVADKSAVTSPSSANEFIIAIAAQERRVLELREELSRAETDLSTLKKQFSAQEAYNRKNGQRQQQAETPRSGIDADDERSSARHSIDLDRRKLLLQQQQNTPTQNRRRVLRGGHTRTLSLLSPPKPDPGIAIHEDRTIEPISLPLPPIERRTAQLTNPNLSKRASWQPQSYSQQANVPGFIEDFRTGLRTFVEDIRQITVGDEPINGQSPVRSPSQQEAGIDLTSPSSGDYETIRPNNAARPKVSTAFDSPSSATSTPTPASKTTDALKSEKTKAGRSKHFSWTPLSVDSLDDNGWSNWDSPSSAKSTRWSGSTINSGGMDDIQSIPEGEENDESSKQKSPTAEEGPLLSPKLGEILPSMVNRLTPSNIKRTANNLMDEWEKSLADPSMAHEKENSA